MPELKGKTYIIINWKPSYGIVLLKQIYKSTAIRPGHCYELEIGHKLSSEYNTKQETGHVRKVCSNYI